MSDGTWESLIRSAARARGYDNVHVSYDIAYGWLVNVEPGKRGSADIEGRAPSAVISKIKRLPIKAE